LERLAAAIDADPVVGALWNPLFPMDKHDTTEHRSFASGRVNQGSPPESDTLTQQRALRFTQFSIDRVSDAAYWMTEDGRFFYVNEAACRALGYRRDELLGMTVHQIDPDFPIERWSGHWEELRACKHLRFESHHRTKDGRIFPVEISANFIEFDGRQYNCVFARDISERRQAEIERQRLIKALEEKNRELQGILAIASHDLRSPLVNVQGFAGELERSCNQLRQALIDDNSGPAPTAWQTLLDEDIPEALHFIRAGVERIDALVNGLLRLARIGVAALELGRIDMDDVMRSIRHALRYQTTRTDTTIEADLLPPCYGDRALVEQVFINIVDNALKYRAPDHPCHVHVSAARQGNRVRYAVTDNGIGIDPAEHDKIFELFYRLDPGGPGGEGLGLTIIRRILDRLDGQIQLESEPGQGSTFYVTLPAC